MAIRARRSFKVAPGVRINVSKTGVGASVGAGPARYSVHSSGRKTFSARTGIPGITYQKSLSGGGHSNVVKQTQQTTVGHTAAKPGLFAPKGEKQLYKALEARDVQAIKDVGDNHPSFRLASYSLAGLLLLADDPQRASALLGDVLGTGQDPAKDEFIAKYLLAWLPFDLAPGITVDIPIGREAVGLALAQLKREAGDLDSAIRIAETLPPTPYVTVSLVQLYNLAGRFDDVIRVTEAVSNENDTSAFVLVQRGMALRQQGFLDAAQETLKMALRYRSRAMQVRMLALSERAATYLAQGRTSLARKDLERILAEDSGFEGVRERLVALADPLQHRRTTR